MVADLPQPEHALLDAFAAHLRWERRLSEYTVTAYRRDVSQLAVFLDRNGASLSAAEYPLLRRFLAQQHTLGYARASIARRVGAIHTFYRWAVAEGRVERDPSLLLGRPKVVSRLPTVLRPRDAAALVEAPAQRAVDPPDGPLGSALALRDRALLELLYGSGLRVAEAAGLTLEAVDLRRGRVLVHGKGDKEREVPMSDF
ncbi:MAG: site-specific integrase, partial [Actinomycetota bacterium]